MDLLMGLRVSGVQQVALAVVLLCLGHGVVKHLFYKLKIKNQRRKHQWD